MAEGHPLKRAILQGEYSDEEDFWEQVGAPANACSVKLIKPDKKEVKVEEPKPQIQKPQMPTMLRPIVERHQTNSAQNQVQEETIIADKKPKKMSLFAQKRAAAKAAQEKSSIPTPSNSEAESFPDTFEVELPLPQASSQEVNSAMSFLANKKSLGGVGIGDKSIHEENMKTLDGMSQEEIMQARQSVLDMLSKQNPAALEKLKQMANPDKPAQNVNQKVDQQELKQEKSTPIETSETSQAVYNAASQMEETNKFISSTKMNALGQVRLEEPDAQEADTSENKYLSYVTSEEFEELDQKFWRLSELQNLLASSDFHQRLYALELITKAVQSQPISFTVEKLFDSELTQIMPRIKQIIQSSARVDAIMKVVDLYNQICTKVAGPLQTLRSHSYLSMVNNSGLSTHNIFIQDLLGCGNLLAKGLPASDQLLVQLFEEQTLYVLEKSIIKAILVGIEENQIIDSLVDLLTWMATYSKQSCLSAFKVLQQIDVKALNVMLQKDPKLCSKMWSLAKELVTGLESIQDRVLVTELLLNEQLFSQFGLNQLDDNVVDEFFMLLRVAGEVRDTTQIAMELFTVFLELSQNSKSEGFLRFSEHMVATRGYKELNPCLVRLLKQINPKKIDLNYDQIQKLIGQGKELKDPRHHQALLAYLSQSKFILARGDRDSKSVNQCLSLLNIGDEYLLNDLLVNQLFKNHEKDEKQFICLNFFLGYCSSEQRVANSKQINVFKAQLKEKDFFLPLTDDWFIRPLLHLQELETKSQTNLIGAIIAYFQESDVFLGVTASEIIMLITFLVVDGQLPSECHSQVNSFLDTQFSTKPFKACTNPFLLRTHKEVFLESNYTSSIARLFNEQPMSDIPFMYKVYLCSLQTHEHGISFEGRRSLLSETAEVLPCVANQEVDILGSQPNFAYKPEWYTIEGQEVMYYSNMGIKIGQKLPSGSLISKILIKK